MLALINFLQGSRISLDSERVGALRQACFASDARHNPLSALRERVWSLSKCDVRILALSTRVLAALVRLLATRRMSVDDQRVPAHVVVDIVACVSPLIALLSIDSMAPLLVALLDAIVDVGCEQLVVAFSAAVGTANWMLHIGNVNLFKRVVALLGENTARELLAKAG